MEPPLQCEDEEGEEVAVEDEGGEEEVAGDEGGEEEVAPEAELDIPADEAENLFISVGVFIHWLAEDDKKIQEYNYQATKESIERAVSGEPKAKDVHSQKDSAEHPFAAK